MDHHPDSLQAYQDVQEGHKSCLERNLARVRRMRAAYDSIEGLSGMGSNIEEDIRILRDCKNIISTMAPRLPHVEPLRAVDLQRVVDHAGHGIDLTARFEPTYKRSLN